MKNILFDFDGVILDSNAVREEGFRIVLDQYPETEVEQLITFHRVNGGLSRYVKFKYFFEEIRKESPQEKKIMELAEAFSSIMKKRLTDPQNLIQDCVLFIKVNYTNYNMHIVSGSDETELKYLCKELNIDTYFKSIHGSPTPKTKLVKDLLASNNYELNNVLLVGDSINDYEAAMDNNISFSGYNNTALKDHGKYIDSFATEKIL